jgi:hypothetical protein
MAQVLYASASELATVTATFVVGAVPTDPTTVTLAVTDPTGAVTTYTYAAAQIARSSAGVYTKDVPSPTAGDWAYLWTATGTVQDAQAGSWTVEETELGHLYVTPAALRSRIGLAATDTSADLELHDACFAASRSIEQLCDRAFWRTATGTVRVFAACGWYEVELPDFSDLVSVSALDTDGDGDGVFETAWSASDYQLRPVNPAAAPETLPYTEIHALGTRTFPLALGGPTDRIERVQVTGVFGWPAVPHLVRAAAAIQAAELFRLKDAPFGVASFGEYGAIRVRANPMAEQMVRPYRRHPVPVE